MPEDALFESETVIITVCQHMIIFFKLLDFYFIVKFWLQ